MYVNVNGVLRKVSEVYVNVSGAIKTVQTGYVNANGTLRKFIAPLSLLGTGWTSVGDTKISVNTSAQLKFSNSASGSGEGGATATAEVSRAISIPAGAQIQLTGAVSFGVSGLSSKTGSWEILVTGSGTTSTLGQGTLSSSSSISETFLVPEAATSLVLRVSASGSGSGSELGGISVSVDFSKIQLLT